MWRGSSKAGRNNLHGQVLDRHAENVASCLARRLTMIDYNVTRYISVAGPSTRHAFRIASESRRLSGDADPDAQGRIFKGAQRLGMAQGQGGEFFLAPFGVSGSPLSRRTRKMMGPLNPIGRGGYAKRKRFAEAMTMAIIAITSSIRASSGSQHLRRRMRMRDGRVVRLIMQALKGEPLTASPKARQTRSFALHRRSRAGTNYCSNSDYHLRVNWATPRMQRLEFAKKDPDFGSQPTIVFSLCRRTTPGGPAGYNEGQELPLGAPGHAGEGL